MLKATIIQRIVPHYRIPFFESLQRELSHLGIELQLIYGQEYPGTVPRSEKLQYPWAIRIENRYIDTPFGRLVWQPCTNHLRNADLIVIEQANSLLLNHWVMICRWLTKQRLAYWGHGKNFQARTGHALKTRLKDWLINQVDWWFAYTDLSAQIVLNSGFPPGNITVVENAIDTEELVAGTRSVTAEDVAVLKAHLGLSSSNIGLYCGGMYADKQLDFLLEAAQAIRKQVNDFNLIFIGSGPDQWKIEQAAKAHAWIHYVGPKFGQERVVFFKASQALLIPGAVGLAIVDSFITETPLFTTDRLSHGPEIAYLKNGENGVMTAPTVFEYSDKVVHFLKSPEQQNRLRAGCLQSSQVHTMSNFVHRFVNGIVQCLAIDGYKR